MERICCCKNSDEFKLDKVNCCNHNNNYNGLKYVCWKCYCYLPLEESVEINIRKKLINFIYSNFKKKFPKDPSFSNLLKTLNYICINQQIY